LNLSDENPQIQILNNGNIKLPLSLTIEGKAGQILRDKALLVRLTWLLDESGIIPLKALNLDKGAYKLRVEWQSLNQSRNFTLGNFKKDLDKHRKLLAYDFLKEKWVL